ncbi:MAG: hypothetical protein AB8F65_04270 [Woeseiaceae bacterium]
MPAHFTTVVSISMPWDTWAPTTTTWDIPSTIICNITSPTFHQNAFWISVAPSVHSTLLYAELFPEAEVHAIDVSAACVTYGHHRAEGLGMPVH